MAANQCNPARARHPRAMFRVATQIPVLSNYFRDFQGVSVLRSSSWLVVDCQARGELPEERVGRVNL